MSDLAWMIVAFAAVAVGVGGYVASMVARRRRLERIRDRRARNHAERRD